MCHVHSPVTLENWYGGARREPLQYHADILICDMTPESQNSAVRETPWTWPLLGSGSVIRSSNSRISVHFSWLLTMVARTLNTPPLIVPLLIALFPCISVCLCISTVLLLSNSPVARHHLNKHIPVAMNMYSTCTREELLDTSFSVRSMLYQRKIDYNETSIHNFHRGSLKWTIDAEAYINWIKTVTFAYVYLLNQKAHTNDIISTVKSNLHYLFLKKSLIHICLVAPFIFKLINNLSILTTFAWSLMVMSWPYMNTLIDWNSTQINKKQWHEALKGIEHTWLTVCSSTQKRELNHTNHR
jgi:hypothetical protein